MVAAETGSGKTHGYLVPLVDKLCRVSDVTEGDFSDKSVSSNRQLSLVLCPNVMLCEQVVRMANCLSDDSGKPLLGVAAICGRQVMALQSLCCLLHCLFLLHCFTEHPVFHKFQISLQGWPVNVPDIVVSTPVALLNYLYAVEGEKGRRSTFIRRVRYVVIVFPSDSTLIILHVNNTAFFSFNSLNLAVISN